MTVYTCSVKMHLYEAIHPSLLAFAISGLSVLQVDNKAHKLKIYNVLRTLAVVYLTFYTATMYHAFTTFSSRNFKSDYASGVSNIGLIFQLLTQVLLTYIVYGVNMLKGEQMLVSVEKIREIDEIFKDLGETMAYKKHFFYELGVIGGGLVTTVGHVMLNYVYMTKHVIVINTSLYLVFAIPTVTLFLSQTQFTLLVKLIGDRYGFINQQLNNLIKLKRENRDQSKAFTINPFSDPYEIKKSENFKFHSVRRIELLMELHDSLNDVGCRINQIFSIQILVCFTTQFIANVFSIFYLYFEALVLKNRMAGMHWLGWTLLIILEILHITITCHLTTREAKNTGIVIHKVLMEDNDGDSKRKLMVFSQQVSHRELEFTACGLFPIDATLLFTISGAAATFLLIMLQFQEGIEAQCSGMNRTVT